MGLIMSPKNRRRFLAKCRLVDSGCIEWTGYRNNYGYGKVTIKSQLWSAHKAAYVDVYGKVPEGMVVRHDCDNPACVNLQHLRLGTEADNAADKAIRGRQPSKLTEDQVREIRAATGKQRAIAQQYSISPAAVCRIKSGKLRQRVEA
jgi:hypothetical protein